MAQHPVNALLETFRTGRRDFQQRLLLLPPDRRPSPPDPDDWSARDLFALGAAWLDEANDRIPRLLAGAPPVSYDVDAFNRAAVARAQGWSADQALGAFRRAADRFEAIVESSDPDDIAEVPAVIAWLTAMTAAVMGGRFDEINGERQTWSEGRA
jgi:hypothetical protein